MTPRATLAAGLVAAALGLAILGAALAAEPLLMLRAWLVAAHFWTAISVGATVLLLIHAVTGGRWGEALSMPLRAAAGAVPVAALAWVPLLASAGALFPWAGKPREALAPAVVKKLAYLDVGFLQLRTVVVLCIFVGLAWAAGAWSGRRPAVAAAAGGLMAFGLATTFFVTDWLMALEPSFYSTIYPALHGTGAVAAALALGTLWLRTTHAAEPARMQDCGMLMLGWAMLWIYMVFMQYLIIWSGNLPHQIEWYIVRVGHGWRAAILFALLAHVGAVAAMASPTLKARPDAAAAAAAAMLLGQAADFWWRTAPAFEREGLLAGALDLAALAALGGFWLAAAMAATGTRREAPNG